MPVLPTSGFPFDSAQLSRRGLIAAGIAGGLTLAGCSSSKPDVPSAAAQMNAAIAAAEAARPHSGRTVTASLTPQVTEIDLGGPIARTFAFGNSIPGPVIRAKVGDELAVTVSNRLDHPTSVHWHGIALRNDMDGAAPATPNIVAGQDFTYRFSVPNSGTYWGHPHTGLDEDTGLYLPVIVDDPTEGDYDAEWIVVLDDWTDGVGKSPQQLYDELTNPNKPSMPMPAATPTPATPPTTTTTSTTTSTTSTTTKRERSSRCRVNNSMTCCEVRPNFPRNGQSETPSPASIALSCVEFAAVTSRCSMRHSGACSSRSIMTPRPRRHCLWLPQAKGWPCENPAN